MLEDARLRKIDLILTKSISRFARNTLLLLETVRELKDLGIAVYFEREKINSLTSDGELTVSYTHLKLSFDDVVTLYFSLEAEYRNCLLYTSRCV